MIVCPVCEHAQPGGAECEVCGRPLAGALPQAQGERPIEAFPDLEPTGFAGVAAPADGLLSELETTGLAPVEALAAEAIPDLERGGAPLPEEERTPYPVLVTCRYCGTEGGLGERLCVRCGMRLPLPEALGVELADEAAVRCGCGMAYRGAKCPACGARPPS